MKTLEYTLKILNWQYLIALALVVVMLASLGATALALDLLNLSPSASDLIAGGPDYPPPPPPKGGGDTINGYSWGG
jgi:hypothetical protein